MGTLPNPIGQAAVIAVRADRVCLITSRGRKRWLFPKGCLEPGKTLSEIALQEAWEEAGLVGTLDPEPLGSYFYVKYGATHHVTVFVLSVTEIAENWPERTLRQRSWVGLKKALASIQDEGLRELIRKAVRDNPE